MASAPRDGSPRPKRNTRGGASSRIYELCVIIEAFETGVLVSASTSEGGGGSGSLEMQNLPDLVRSVQEAISYARVRLLGEPGALPFSLRRLTGDSYRDFADLAGRRVIIRTARNGYVVEPSFKRAGAGWSASSGWIRAQGDTMVFHDLSLALGFCRDYLGDLPGTNWWDWRP